LGLGVFGVAAWHKTQLGMIYFTLFLSLYTTLTTALAIVPQVKLCAYTNCPSVSRIGMGTLHLGDSIEGLTDVNEIKTWIEDAYSLGITLFDLADVYPVKGGDAGTSASLFGQALALTGLRSQITLVAKMDIIFPSTIDTSREHLQSTLDWYLSVLMTDYVDILILHYSNSFMNATEVSEFFIDMKATNKAHFFGVSNHYPSKFNLLQDKLDELTGGDIKLVTHEFEASVWNPSSMNYNNEIADHAYQLQIHPLAWGPLGGDPIGGLNRLFVRVGDRQRKILNALGDVGEAIGVSDESIVALIWLLEHPVGFIPLLGTTKTARLRTQVTAFQHLGKMTVEQWWSIGGKGGLCALGDSQCNYSEYMAK
jgi:predicted oxidoreductase